MILSVFHNHHAERARMHQIYLKNRTLQLNEQTPYQYYQFNHTSQIPLPIVRDIRALACGTSTKNNTC